MAEVVDAPVSHAGLTNGQSRESGCRFEPCRQHLLSTADLSSDVSMDLNAATRTREPGTQQPRNASSLKAWVCGVTGRPLGNCSSCPALACYPNGTPYAWACPPAVVEIDAARAARIGRLAFLQTRDSLTLDGAVASAALRLSQPAWDGRADEAVAEDVARHYTRRNGSQVELFAGL